MLILKSTDILRLVTTAAVDIDVSTDYVDRDPGFSGATELAPRFLPDDTPTKITTATTTTIVAAPGAGIQRNVTGALIENVHATSSNTITVERYNGSTAVRRFKCTLLAGERALMTEIGSWLVYDVSGGVKSTGTGIVEPSTNGFRLSGVSATPVMTADSTTLSTIFLCQWKSNRIALYDGTNWQLCTPSSEPSLAVTGRTTDLPFDIFGYSVAGVVTLEFLNWTSATARATGLTRVDGVWTKTGDPTRRYLGSCRARSATTFHWVRNGDDLPVKLDLWNVDNRVEASFTLRALTNTWAYTIATWRQAQASANYQADVMVGLQEESFTARLMVTSTNATTTVPREVGIGFDSTTAFTGLTASSTNEAAVASQQVAIADIKHQPTIGRHFYAWLEISTALGTTTWFGDNGALRIQSGLVGNWEC